MRKNQSRSIQFDGLGEEEVALILSLLPKDGRAMRIAAMDKGLSGARVLSARYRLGDRFSKQVVLKVGSSRKLLREAAAISNYAAPHIQGIEAPVVRCGKTRALVVQELRGLTISQTPTSLRIFARTDDRIGQVVDRLLRERLFPWYSSLGPRGELSLRECFEIPLRKGPDKLSNALPSDWVDLTQWVEEVSGHAWISDEAVDQLLDSRITTGNGIIHGDLHSQNVLVDETSLECWPIDFGWCMDGRSPLVDLAMLECSFKFLAIPMRSDLRNLIEIEQTMSIDFLPPFNVPRVPYNTEINRCYSAIRSVREFALSATIGASPEDYMKALFAMTYSLALHDGLNRPFLLASLQILANIARIDQ